jgi:hypothetical protein
MHVKMLSLLSFGNFELSKEFFSLCTPCSPTLWVKALALLSFSTTQTPKGFRLSIILLEDGECNGLLALCFLKQPLAEPFRVFNNPVKIPQWILPSTHRTQKSSLLFSVPVCTLTQMPTWQSIFS